MKLNQTFSIKKFNHALTSHFYLPLAIIIFAIIYIFLSNDYPSKNQQFNQPPIKVEREFRAAWVATVANINWPSEPGLSVDIQQKEAIKILDNLQANNFNAVIFQVRPQSDALYQSDLEPWSFFLTGTQGHAPEPFYDPLAFWIDQSHQRGLELHAWLNPYRAHHIEGGKVSDQSVVKTHPELVVQLEMGYHWLIPTMEETIQYSLDVVMDIVKRYDVDGIHFDDYFYPYPSYNNGKDFPDDKSYADYQSSGGKMLKDDWRRDHVNTFIKRVYKGIKAEKNHVKFGLSPFGIWRPGYPESIEGMDQYEKLFADAKLWLNEGWIDYFAPQLYWQINRYPQSFPLLLNWWEDENTKNRHLWPGIHTRLAENDIAIDESINQIMISRAMLSNRPGNIFWNVSSLELNPAFGEQLVNGPYKKQALIPAYFWLDGLPPVAPKLKAEPYKDRVELSWLKTDKEKINHWIIYTKYADHWNYQILTRNQLSIGLDSFNTEINMDKHGVENTIYNYLTEVGVTAVDSVGNESSWSSLKVKTPEDINPVISK